LFDSLAKGFGARGCAILLSGFGNDGVDEFGQIHQAGGVTIAQSPDSATFPNNIIQAVEAGTAEHVVPPAAIAETIRAIRSARLVA
jgi:two-component system chemotaxis response regulator CheB